MVVIEGLTFRYAAQTEPAIDGIDLAIGAGEYIVLAGASGSGKSTLLRCLSGLIPHLHRGQMSGRVLIDGLDSRHTAQADLFDKVGIVLQSAQAQLFSSSVARELAYGLESLGLTRSLIRQRVADAAAEAGIGNLLDRAPHTLSGGEQQRVALAAILALQPPVLCLDEPFAHLDPLAAEDLRCYLAQEKLRGTTILVAEHRLGTVLADADRLLVLDGGRLVRDGHPRHVLGMDLTALGVNVPLAARVGLTLGIQPCPLSVNELPTASASLQELETALARHLPQGPRPACLVGRQAPSGTQRVLEVHHLSSQQAGQRVLSDVSFELAAGESLVVAGGNGAGKTSLLKHLNGLRRATSGRIAILGRDPSRTRVSAMARFVGIAFQDPNDQIFSSSVQAELEAGPRALGCLDRAWLDEIVTRFELGPLLGRSPFTLSEGQKRRLAFACALAARPAILALDEPSAGQDERFRNRLRELLADIQRTGATTVVVTHDLELAESLSSRWLALGEGRLLAEGAPDRVMADDAVMQAARLVPTDGHRLASAVRHVVPLRRAGPAHEP